MDVKFEVQENQRKFWFPQNIETSTVYYNQRMIWSADIHDPLTWRVTKVENTAPYGINKITFAQDKFDQYHDYVERDKDGFAVAMWADYYQSEIKPEKKEPDLPSTKAHGELTWSGINSAIKVGGSYKTFTVNFYDKNNQPVDATECTWRFEIDGIAADDYLKVLKPDESTALQVNQIKVKAIDDSVLLNKVMKISVDSSAGVAELLVELIGL